jgi:hypothetical protein
MDKSPEKIKNRRIILKLIKSTYDKSIVNITLNSEKQCISSKIRNRCLHSTLLFTIVLKFLARSTRQEKEIK